MPRGAEQGHEDLKATEFIEKELGVKGFKTVDLLSGFVYANGGNLDGNFLNTDFNLRTLLLEGKIKALAKTDFCVYRDSLIGKHAHLDGTILSRKCMSGVMEIGSFPNRPKTGA